MKRIIINMEKQNLHSTIFENIKDNIEILDSEIINGYTRDPDFVITDLTERDDIVEAYENKLLTAQTFSRNLEKLSQNVKDAVYKQTYSQAEYDDTVELIEEILPELFSDKNTLLHELLVRNGLKGLISEINESCWEIDKNFPILTTEEISSVIKRVITKLIIAYNYYK